MDTLEILTLDKEQLVMDNELLQVQMDDINATIKGNSSVKGEALVAEENIKLREALRRLHLQSTSDKSLYDTLNISNEKNSADLILLREYKGKTEEELSELRIAVDAATSYENLIEVLTEKDLEQSHKLSQLELTVRDLEEQQELSEELDQQQRQEIDLSRKKLDSASIQLSEKDTSIRSFELKAEELKKLNEKFRKNGEQLRAELDELRGQVSLSEAESQRALNRARASTASHAIQVKVDPNPNPSYALSMLSDLIVDLTSWTIICNVG